MGENVLAPKYNLPKYRTNLGMVFQSLQSLQQYERLGKLYVWTNNCPETRLKTAKK